MPMIIRCYGCGTVHDVVLRSEESHDFPCPACGKLDVYDLGALKAKVVAANKRLLRRIGGE